MSFDGNGYINAPDSASLSITVPGSVATWFKIRSTLDEQVIVVKGIADGTISYGIHFDNPPIAATFWVDSDGFWGPSCAVGTGTNSIATNTWYHIVGTWDGTNIRIYLNGRLISSGGCTASTIDTTGALSIGGNVTGWTYLNGIIDEVRIYSSTLTGMEIQQLYAQAAPRYQVALSE